MRNHFVLFTCWEANHISTKLMANGPMESDWTTHNIQVNNTGPMFSLSLYITSPHYNCKISEDIKWSEFIMSLYLFIKVINHLISLQNTQVFCQLLSAFHPHSNFCSPSKMWKLLCHYKKGYSHFFYPKAAQSFTGYRSFKAKHSLLNIKSILKYIALKTRSQSKYLLKFILLKGMEKIQQIM